MRVGILRMGGLVMGEFSQFSRGPLFDVGRGLSVLEMRGY